VERALPTETLTLLGIDWVKSEPLDAGMAARLFDHPANAPTVCQCPIPGVTLLAYRSATGAVDDALRVLDAWPAKLAMLTCEYGKLDYIGFSPVAARLYGLLGILPAGVAVSALSTYEAVRHASEEGALFLDLGPVGLPEIGGRERVFQIARLGSEPEMIALDRGERAIDTLPSEFGYFVGRKGELEHVYLHLEQGRSVTLTGVAGIGKSHLATRAARELKSSFASGVAWVSLPGASTPPQVHAALAAGLNLPATSDVFGSIRRIITEEQLLVVLDGVDECRETVRELLDGPLRGVSSRFIVTSLMPVGYVGEEVIPLAPMTVPSEDTIVDPDDLYDYESSALFLDRVTELSEELTKHLDPDAVAELMRRLEGHPQRIRMAAAQTRFQSVPMILRELPAEAKVKGRSRFGLSLGALPKVVQDAAIALSLCETPVSLFQLGKLDERFQVDPSAIETLRRCGLCDESLSPSGRVVYSLYPSVKAQVRRISSPMRKKLARRHEELFIKLVHEAVSGHNMTAAAGDLDLAEEHAPDFFTALGSFVGRGNATDFYQALIGAWPFLYDHNHVEECLPLIEAKVAAPGSDEALATAKLLNMAGALASKAGWSRKARSCYEAALVRLETDEDLAYRAGIVTNLAILEWADGNAAGARDRYVFAADLLRYAGDSRGLAHALMSSVLAHIECGDPSAARRALDEAISLAPSPTPLEQWCFAIAKSQCEWATGDYPAAKAHATEGVQLAVTMKDQLSVLRSLIWLAQALLGANQLAQSTHVLAVAAHNQTEHAYRLYPANDVRVRRMTEALVSGLGEPLFRAEFISGSTRTLDEVLAGT